MLITFCSIFVTIYQHLSCTTEYVDFYSSFVAFVVSSPCMFTLSYMDLRDSDSETFMRFRGPSMTVLSMCCATALSIESGEPAELLFFFF